MVSDEYLTESELAADLDKSPRTVKRWRARRVGPPFLKVGKTIWYRRDAVREWLRSLEQEQPRAGGRAA